MKALKSLRKAGLGLALLAASLGLASASHAVDTFPNQQVTLVVPYSAGGATDVVGRILAKYLSDKLGQTFIVENTLGGGGITGALAVSSSPADGSMLLFAAHSAIITPLTVKDTEHDVQKDLTPIAELTTNPFVLIVRSDSQIKTTADLVAYAKANPDKFSWGLGGLATPGHLGIVKFMESAGFDGLIVPFSGESTVVNSLLAGEVDAMFASPTAARTALDSGKAVALAVTSKDPMDALFPGVPTLTSQGFPVEAGSWFALWGPKGMDPALVDQIYKVFTDAVKDPEIVAKLTEIGTTTIPSDSPAAFADLVAKTATEDTEILKRLGLYKSK